MRIYSTKTCVIAVSCIFLFSFITNADAQSLTFTSSDSALQTSFNSAVKMALSYKGKPADPVGPWYESALPPRYAFCMRDVSHQSIAAEILGLSAANKNMMGLFVKNISKEKDWCSYWEINKNGKPAVEDYRSDSAFWYNLNANFDVLSACWKLYQWTGDKAYISAPEYLNFYQKSTNDFLDTWILHADSLLTRPSHPREKSGYNRKDSFHEYRGLPSYSESVPHVKMGVDLIAAIYRGLLSYAAILRVQGRVKDAEHYEQKAASYSQQIENHWWDADAGLYNTHYTDEGLFGKGEGETFLLWFNALKDPVRINKTINHLISTDWNMENLSYLPYQLYSHNYPREAYRYVLHLTHPDTKRREYPEVSYGAIQAVVQGLMGIEADARTKTISTIFRGHDESVADLDGIHVLGGFVNVKHRGYRKTSFKNTGNSPVKWKAKFGGRFDFLVVGKKQVKAFQESDEFGRTYSFVKLDVAPGKEISVSNTTEYN